MSWNLSGVVLIEDESVRTAFLPKTLSEPVPWDTLIAAISSLPDPSPDLP